MIRGITSRKQLTRLHSLFLKEWSKEQHESSGTTISKIKGIWTSGSVLGPWKYAVGRMPNFFCHHPPKFTIEIQYIIILQTKELMNSQPHFVSKKYLKSVQKGLHRFIHLMTLWWYQGICITVIIGHLIIIFTLILIDNLKLRPQILACSCFS